MIEENGVRVGIRGAGANTEGVGEEVGVRIEGREVEGEHTVAAKAAMK